MADKQIVIDKTHNLALEPRVCPLCGDAPYEVVGRGLDYIFRIISIEIECRRCRRCNAVYPHLQPVFDQLSLFYKDDFFNDTGQSVAGAAMKRQLLFRNGRLIRRLAQLAALKPGFKLLDVGSGRGDLLAILQNQFPKGEYHSIDLRQKMLIDGVHHHQGYFEQYDFGGQRFDVVTATHFIEHVYSPQDLLARAASLLEPGGFVFISTPNVDALEFQIMRRRLYCGGYYVPRHLTLFNERSFRFMVDCIPGLRIESLNHFFTVYHWVSLVHHWLYDLTRWDKLDRWVNYHNVFVAGPFYLFDLFRYKLGFRTGVLEVFLTRN